MELIQHFSHEHPLVFIQDSPLSSEDSCFGCEEPVEGPNYCCSTGCKFYLHKRCAELVLGSEINHPLHPRHPLFLLPKPVSYEFEDIRYCCNFCYRVCSGFVYHCMSCDFGLDISCAFLELSVIRKFPRLQHFSHHHPLLLMEKHKKRVIGSCAACVKQLSGEIYRCFRCNFDLHKECAELPLEVNHPFHSPHPLILLSQSPCYEISLGIRINICHFCHNSFTGFVYRCVSCKFDLDVDCALLQLSIAGNFHKLEHFSHEHPLISNEKYNKDGTSLCSGCRKPISGPFYRCVDCISFDLHKECAELPLEINHPYDRKHPLTLLPNPPTHPENCTCYLCEIGYKGFIYYCSVCKIGLNPEDVSLQRVITDASHEHPWVLLSTRISFICNFCGIHGDCAPYVCTTCDLVVHKKCISLPHKIKITRHHHPISHTYFLQENLCEKRECRICYDEVKTEYGNYHCSDSDCNFIAHVKCATDAANWDEAYVLEDKDEAKESMNLITDVIRETNFGEDVVASEIKHAYHEHNLIITFIGEVKGDNVCDGCMRNISLPFYGCEQCGFFLHRECAELPRVKQRAIHKHLLTLTKGSLELCSACFQIHHGFSYACEFKSCNFKIDIKCSSLSDILSHPSHEHLLLLIGDYQGHCSSCHRNRSGFVYRCKERCGFIICFECATLPLTAWWKYDKHPLTLTYYDHDSDQSRLYCDICEEERDPSNWFYYCADCDTSVHSNCVLGDLPFIKLGSVFSSGNHPHMLKFFKKIWNSPRCDICNGLCGGQALECANPGCKLICHFECLAS